MVAKTGVVDDKAEQGIRLADQERSKAQNFMNLYQQVADLIYPIENQINTERTPGVDKSLPLRNPTGIFALDDMVAGLIGTWIPSGRLFFGLRIKDRGIAELPHIKRYLARATQIAHDEMFDSNFMLQLHGTVKSLGAFGTANLMTEWDNRTLGLNYKDFHISLYTIKENSRGRVDTVIMEYEKTARQISQDYENLGEQVEKAISDINTESKMFPIIHIIRPRIERNVMLVDNLNMPFESIVINRTERIVMAEGGFLEFPNAIPRWEKSSSEKYGRGRGTILLSAIKESQQMHKDLVECGNRWNNPTLEVVDNNVEGEVTNIAGEINHVTEKGSIKGLEGQMAGNFPISKDMLEFQNTIIKEGFYSDIWRQFSDLKGDRRVTLEIEARLKEGLRRLVSPVTRMEQELFSPVIKRSVLELIRNGRIPQPPPELQGKSIGIEYLGELAMAMRSFQARAVTQFASLVTELDPIWPGAKDTINMDRTLPDIAISMGVKEEHLSTEDEIQEIRADRAAKLQREEMLQAADVGSKAIKDTSQTPEEGSPAQQLLETIGA